MNSNPPASRWRAPIQDGTNLTKKDVVNILEAFRRFIENAQQVSAAGFQLKG